MPNERARIAMTGEEIADFLRAGAIAVVASTGADGIPHVVPMFYVVDDDGRIAMRTYAKSQKARNLERNPTAAVLVETGERYAELKGVQLTGPIELSRDVDRILWVIEGLARKYEGVEEFDRDAVRTYAGKQVAMTVRPDKVVSWDHGKL